MKKQVIHVDLNTRLELYEVDLIQRLRPFHGRPTNLEVIEQITAITRQWAIDWSIPPTVEYDAGSQQFNVTFDFPAA